MAQIIINVYKTKKGLKVDVDTTIPVNEVEKEEGLMSRVITQSLTNVIGVYNEGFDTNVQTTDITKTLSNTNKRIVNRVIEYDN